MLKQILLITLLGSLGSLTGCSLFEPKVKEVDKLVYVTTPLHRPNRPILPTLTLNDLECLTPDALQKLKEREVLRRQYAEELELIIDSTRKK